MFRYIGKGVRDLLKDPDDYLVKDVYRIATLLQTFNYYSQHPQEDISEERIQSFAKSIENKISINWEETNAVLITQQIRDLFTHIANHETIPLDYMNLQGKIKHRFTIQESTIPNAGNGVFLKSSQKILPGTVLGLFPGVVHISSLFRNKEYFQFLSPDPNLMLAMRIDGTVIDGRAVDKVPSNPYAVSHLVNHCGKRPPNVINVTYDFPNNARSDMRFSVNHRKFVPNVYARYPPEFHDETLGCFMKGMVMIACDSIKDGEELMMDYRLNLKSKLLPSWYEPHDTKDSKMRWSF